MTLLETFMRANIYREIEMGEKSISDKIWETRKIRINTESRLIMTSRVIEVLIPWYSFILIVINFIPIQKNNDWIFFMNSGGSLFVLIFSIILTNRDYKTRALRIKDHYLKLIGLYLRLKDKNGIITEQEASKEYCKYLEEVENHSRSDYLKALFQNTNKGTTFEKMNFIQKFEYHLTQLFKLLFIIFLFSVPVIAYLLIP